jgi:hypothetical protein
MSAVANRNSDVVLPLRPTPVAPFGELALVADISEAGLIVEFGSARLPARVALSCLIQPEPGDRVLLVSTREGLWAVALVERGQQRPLSLTVHGGLDITAIDGPLRLTGDIAVEIASPRKVSITAGDLTVYGQTAKLLLDDVLHIGRQIAAHVGRVRLVGELLETLVDRLLGRAKRSYRFVEECEHLRSGHIDYRATETLHVRGRNAFITAKAIAKIDGDQIHMG